VAERQQEILKHHGDERFVLDDQDATRLAHKFDVR
jgi:hypothetical protein